MESVRTLIVGAGMTGLATAAALSDRRDDDYVVIDADEAIGGWCKTVKKEDFVWDYSGHFFHFKRPAIEQWLRDRMPAQRVLVVDKKSFIAFPGGHAHGGGHVDFPFQKNIHQLPQADFVECLYDLYFARSSDVKREQAAPERNFLEMLRARFGKGICDRFLVPYNEKLYACDLATLDKDAMGRFFPHADLTDIVRNMKHAENASYNATFTYPEGGAIEYVNALASAVRAGRHLARRAPRRRSTSRARSRRTTRTRARLRAPRLERALRPLRRALRAPEPGRHLGVQQGARLQPRLRRQGQERRALVLLPVARDGLLPRRLVRQHLRHRPHEPLRRDRASRAAPPSTSPPCASACWRTCGARASSPRSASSPSTRSCWTPRTSTSRGPRWPSTRA